MGMFDWMKSVSFYGSWQSEKSRREHFQKLSEDYFKQLDECRNSKPPPTTVFRPPAIDNEKCVIRTVKEEQEIILKYLGGRGFRLDFKDVRFRCAKLDDFEKVIIPFVRKHMGTWTIDFSDCDDFSSFLNSAASMWFKVNSVHPIDDTKGAHSYNLIIPAEGGLYVCEPNPSGGFLTKIEDFKTSQHYTLNGGTIYGR